MVRGIAIRAVGGLLLAVYIILVGGCGSGGQPPQTFTDTATVRGVILESRNGVPLADAKVRIGSIIAHVEKSGAFVMVVPVGTQERLIMADGYVTYSDTVAIASGENDLGAVYLFELPPPPPQF